MESSAQSKLCGHCLETREMNGLNRMAAIRDEFPEAKIFMLTTYAGDDSEIRGTCTRIRTDVSGRIAPRL